MCTSSSGKVNSSGAHVAVAILVLAALAGGAQALPAFPGAEGPGSTASGGRSYSVYHVTNLNDTGAGSFREAITGTGASNRIVVFDVGGTIWLSNLPTDHWLRTGANNITVAGQTAPGGGIVIYGQGVKFTGTNVVIRNIHFRSGDAQDPTRDDLWLQTKDSIVDHCSAEWATDEGISSTDAARNTTVQYSIIAEGLNYNGHSYGGMIGFDTPGEVVTYHHNLFAHNKSRNPRIGNVNSIVNVVDFRNNAVYDWISNCGYSGDNEEGDVNFIGNYYIAGPSTSTSTKAFSGGSGGKTNIYQSGNKIDSNKNGVFDGTDTGWGMFTGSYGTSPGGTAYTVPTVYTQTADDALQTVLNYAGAFWWNRDTVDARIVNQVRTGTGAVISHTSDVGGFTYYPQVFRDPNVYDPDRDGMLSDWETAHGLDPSVADGNGDYDADGYTNIEEYINQLGWFPPPKPIIWLGGSSGTAGRYELITNWDIPWQPTLADQAEINSGKATVAYPNQEAGTLYVANTAAGSAELSVTAGKLTIGNALHLGSASGARGTASISGGMMAVSGSVALGGGGGGAVGLLTLTGGSLTATGPIVLASASSSTGELKVARAAYVEVGGLTINSGGGRSTKVSMELDANGPSLIRTTGAATLAGTLAVDRTTTAYRPSQGNQFTLILATSGTSNFGSITSNIPGLLLIDPNSLGLGYWPIFRGAFDANADYVVTFQGAMPGDAGGDNKVNAADLGDLAANWGQSGRTWTQGDFGGDGQVNAADLGDLAANWGQTGLAPSAAPPEAPIPEPATLTLLSLVSLATLRRKR